MAIASTQLTLADIGQRSDPNGNVGKMTNVLQEQNDFLLDAIWLEANDKMSNKTIRVSALPTPTARVFNQGTPVTKGRTRVINDVLEILEAFSEIDEEVLELSSNKQQTRNDEIELHLEGMNQAFISDIFTGNNGTDPAKINGLQLRMPSLSAATNVIGAGGTGSDLTSIYGVQWGRMTANMIHPMGSEIGLTHNDLGLETASTATTAIENTELLRVWRDQIKFKFGFVVKNTRSIIRYANIETAYNATTNIFDEDHLITLINRMPFGARGLALYANATLFTQMQIKLKDKNNMNFDTVDGLSGIPVVTFMNFPIRKVEGIGITETAIT